MSAEAPSREGISVVIPVRDGADFLAAAIESVREQTRPAQELTVVDDGSRDDSAAIAASLPGVRVLVQAPSGAAAARNAGVTVSGGMFLAFLDADDVWLPDKLERQAAVLDAHPEVGIVIGRADVLVGDRVVRPPWDDPGEDERRLAPVTSMLVRREVWRRVGGFDARLAPAEDIDWLLRARHAGAGIHVLPDVVMHRRMHERNTVYQSEKVRQGLVRAVRGSIERRRAGIGTARAGDDTAREDAGGGGTVSTGTERAG